MLSIICHNHHHRHCPQCQEAGNRNLGCDLLNLQTYLWCVLLSSLVDTKNNTVAARVSNRYSLSTYENVLFLDSNISL